MEIARQTGKSYKDDLTDKQKKIVDEFLKKALYNLEGLSVKVGLTEKTIRQVYNDWQEFSKVTSMIDDWITLAEKAYNVSDEDDQVNT